MRFLCDYSDAGEGDLVDWYWYIQDERHKQDAIRTYATELRSPSFDRISDSGRLFVSHSFQEPEDDTYQRLLLYGEALLFPRSTAQINRVNFSTYNWRFFT